MEYEQTHLEKALKAAQMYYYQNLPMKKIATELNVSHSTISRLLDWARKQGIVEIRINDIRGRSSPLEELLKLNYKIRDVQVVQVAETAGEGVWEDRVARVAARHLNNLMAPNMVLGVAWSKTISLVTEHLTPKSMINNHIVQLNGGEPVYGLGINHVSEMVTHIANNYEARAHLFPVPAFFDHPGTKKALWRERSIQRILTMQKKCDIALFSIGSIEGQRISALGINEQLVYHDYEAMMALGAVGDIANILIREDGSYHDIPLNERACGPELTLLRDIDRAICVVSGHHKIMSLKGALNGRYITDLIIDEPTARRLVESLHADS